MVKSLYTSKEVKEFKDKLIKEQQGIDPILNEPFKEVVCQDHDHFSQHCRAALNRNTNAFEGLVINAYKRCLSWLTDKPLPEILRGLANYLEQDYTSNPYHPAWLKKVKTEFNKLSASQQNLVLLGLGSEIGKNPKERKEKFLKLILDRSFGYVKIIKLINASKER